MMMIPPTSCSESGNICDAVQIFICISSEDDRSSGSTPRDDVTSLSYNKRRSTVTSTVVLDQSEATSRLF